MDLWIRTQDREDLIKCDNLGLAYKGKYNWVDNDFIKDNEFYICQFTENYHSKLGKYATKERALEILDEIQEFIEKGCIEYKSTGNCYTSKYEYSAYKMPKEE